MKATLSQQPHTWHDIGSKRSLDADSDETLCLNNLVISESVQTGKRLLFDKVFHTLKSCLSLDITTSANCKASTYRSVDLKIDSNMLTINGMHLRRMTVNASRRSSSSISSPFKNCCKANFLAVSTFTRLAYLFNVSEPPAVGELQYIV